MTIGVVYITYGPSAAREAANSIQGLRKYHDWPVAVIGDMPMEGVWYLPQSVKPGRAGRWAKVNLMELSPFDWTLYLDADTRVRGDLSIGFDILRDGWEMVMVPSKLRSHPISLLAEKERLITLAELKDSWPLVLNTGVMWFRRTPRTVRLWQIWHEEWQRFQEYDQGALLRALNRCPLALWLLGRPFNAGSVVEHLFGRARA